MASLENDLHHLAHIFLFCFLFFALKKKHEKLSLFICASSRDGGGATSLKRTRSPLAKKKIVVTVGGNLQFKNILQTDTHVCPCLHFNKPISETGKVKVFSEIRKYVDTCGAVLTPVVS